MCRYFIIKNRTSDKVWMKYTVLFRYVFCLMIDQKQLIIWVNVRKFFFSSYIYHIPA